MANKINPRALESIKKWGNESLPEDRRNPAKQKTAPISTSAQFPTS